VVIRLGVRDAVYLMRGNVAVGVAGNDHIHAGHLLGKLVDPIGEIIRFADAFEAHVARQYDGIHPFRLETPHRIDERADRRRGGKIS